MGTMDRSWWARFLDRYGAPFIVGKYDPADDKARQILSRAFQAATKIFGLVVSKSTEIDLMSAATGQTGEAFKAFLDVCNDEKSKRILGQTSSVKQAEGGLNNSGNKQHESVRQDIRQYDQMILSLTLEQQLFRPYLDINGFTGATPRMTWGGVSSDEQGALGDLMDKLAQAGYELTDDGLSTLSEMLAFPLQRKAIPASAPGGFGAPLLLTAGDRDRCRGSRGGGPNRGQRLDGTSAGLSRQSRAGEADHPGKSVGQRVRSAVAGVLCRLASRQAGRVDRRGAGCLRGQRRGEPGTLTHFTTTG